MSSRATRASPAIGDVIEIDSPKGLSYVQYTYYHDRPPVYGHLVRVLPGFHEERPRDFSGIVQEDERFFAFCDVNGLLDRPDARIVAREEVPANAVGIPPMRMRGRREIPSFKVLSWRLWNGEEAQGEPLDEDLMNLSIVEICGPGVLVERIVSEWRPEDSVD